MTNKTIKALILILCIFFCAASLQAGSIWSKRSRDVKDLYSDDVARHIGDILTITVIETSKTDNKAKTTMEKKTKRSANFDGNVGIDHVISSLPAINLGAGTEYTNNLDGKADYKDERTFTDSFTVMVVDIMPNGNLVVWGTRLRDIGGSIQDIEVSGIVRTSDIAFDNTIRSEQVANFSILAKNKGASAAFNRRNWLGKIFDDIWPF